LTCRLDYILAGILLFETTLQVFVLTSGKKQLIFTPKVSNFKPPCVVNAEFADFRVGRDAVLGAIRRRPPSGQLPRVQLGHRHSSVRHRTLAHHAFRPGHPRRATG